MFLARTDEQRRFEAALAEITAAATSTDPSQVFLVHGLGGMGKTELCRRFHALARGELPGASGNARKFFAATIDWEDERRNHRATSLDGVGIRPRAILAAIHDTFANHPELGTSRRLRRHAVRAFEPYRRTVAQLPETALRETLTRSDGTVSPDPTEFPGAVLDAGVTIAGLPVAPGASSGLLRAIRDGRSHVDPHLIGTVERTEESLTRGLARGLRDLSEQRPVVIVLDTYEIIASCGGWVRQLMLMTGARVLWVIAARLEPEEETSGRGDMAAFRREVPEENLRLMAMSTFGRKTIGEELRQRGVPDIDDTMLDAVESLTQGVPLAVSLVAGMLAQGENMDEIGRSVTEKGDTTALVRKLTERYLIHTFDDPSLAQDAPLLLGLALLHADRADSEILTAIWGDERDIETTLAELVERHDFVLTDSRRLHHEVRETFRRYQLDGVRRAERRSANRRAAATALERANRLPPEMTIEARVLNDGWRLAVATLVWHRFWEGNDAGLDTLCEVFPAAVLLQRDFAHELVDLASFFKDSFSSEEESTMRGLASLLSFGGFLDGWAAKRHAILKRESSSDPFLASESDAGSADEQTTLEILRNRSNRRELDGLSAPGSPLVDLLIAKSMMRTQPSVALGALTTASNGIPAGEGKLAAEVSQAAQDLAGQLVESVDGADAPAPSAEGMRAGELWAAYSNGSPATSVWFARAHRRRGEIDQALSTYEEVTNQLDGLTDIESRQTLANALYGKAITLEGEERWTEEVDALDELIRKFGDDDDRSVHRLVAYARYFRASALESLNRRGEQIAGYQGVFEDCAADTQLRVRQLAAKALVQKATALQALDDHDRAIKALESLDETFTGENVEMRSILARALFLRGVLLGELRERREEINVYDHLQELFADDEDSRFQVIKAKALFNKGYAFDRLEQPDDAIEAYGDLVDRFGPGSTPELRRLVARGLSERAAALARTDRPPSPQETQDKLELLLTIEPVPPEINSIYSLFLTDVKGDHVGATRAFERAVKSDPKNANTLGNFARLRFEQGEEIEAIDLADRALAIPEATPTVLLEVNFYMVALGPDDRQRDSLRAIRTLLRAGARSPSWNFERILDRAAELERPDVDWLRMLAAVINEEEDEDCLAGWNAWPQS